MPNIFFSLFSKKKKTPKNLYVFVYETMDIKPLFMFKQTLSALNDMFNRFYALSHAHNAISEIFMNNTEDDREKNASHMLCQHPYIHHCSMFMKHSNTFAAQIQINIYSACVLFTFFHCIRILGQPHYSVNNPGTHCIWNSSIVWAISWGNEDFVFIHRTIEKQKNIL